MVELREFISSDSTKLVDLLNDYDVTKYLSLRIPFPYTPEDAEWWVSTGSKNGYIRAITLNGELVGCIGVEMGQFEESLTGEIGYWLGKRFWGKGIATETVIEVTEHIFSNTNTARLVAPVFSPNASSMHVLEKCGYTLEGILKKACYKDNVFYDKYIYAKIRP